MDLSILKEKIRRRLWHKIVTLARNHPVYPYLYRSFWHSKFLSTHKGIKEQYFSAQPDPGAGIGHQMANWIAGYWFAQQFGLRFAHMPFSDQKWEDLLGFGHNEISVDELLEKRQYRKVLLPLFNEESDQEIGMIRNIIMAYKGKNVVFVAEQDQFYRDQFGVQDIIKKKFFSAPSRASDELIFSDLNFNIAIHIRRGDIISDDGKVHENLNMRFQQNDYFIKVLSKVMLGLKVAKPIMVYLFSQGSSDNFKDLGIFRNIRFCLDMPAMGCFLHMVHADLLITSKSSFSYKPALLSNGIKISPANFWHGYPNEDKWILANEDGDLDNLKLNMINDQ